MKKTLMIAAAAAFVMAGFTATEAVAGPEGKCKGCHHFDSTKKKIGPGLKGIFGSTQGSVAGFKYGSYLKAQNAAGAVWDEASMLAWIADSKGVAKAAGGKTKMGRQNVKGGKADKVIAFLKGL